MVKSYQKKYADIYSIFLKYQNSQEILWEHLLIIDLDSKAMKKLMNKNKHISLKIYNILKDQNFPIITHTL